MMLDTVVVEKKLTFYKGLLRIFLGYVVKLQIRKLIMQKQEELSQQETSSVESMKLVGSSLIYSCLPQLLRNLHNSLNQSQHPEFVSLRFAKTLNQRSVIVPKK
jgi:hypothetical protein